MHTLLFLEFIGTSELVVVLVVALIIFGPRKLPELGRSLGKAMHQFRSASEEFKRTWETEARIDAERGALLAPATAEAELGDAATTVEETPESTHEAPALSGLSFAGHETVAAEA
ncbi:MAG: twin-arginine translocase TatA/TatE family subunit [Acidobacteria bacterium]|nr:twin-arginine translocase TatA/TatE family subunit [Acidobacteriota bacterium]